jgi:hypothetical protein
MREVFFQGPEFPVGTCGISQLLVGANLGWVRDQEVYLTPQPGFA